MYDVRDAVSQSLREAHARFANFELGAPAADDATATAGFERILDLLEVESIRVTTAMNEAVEAVSRGREGFARIRDLDYDLI